MISPKFLLKMHIPTIDQLLVDIEKYLEKTNMKAHCFGKKYLNDSGAISRLKKGNDPRLSTVQKIYEAINAKNTRKKQDQ
jgi:predicted transcriptional regulator